MGTRLQQCGVQRYVRIMDNKILWTCIITVNCGPPSLPVNGYVVALTSTLEGAKVIYMVLCDRNKSLVSKEAATCTKNGHWEPNISNTCAEAGLRDSSGTMSRNY